MMQSDPIIDPRKSPLREITLFVILLVVLATLAWLNTQTRLTVGIPSWLWLFTHVCFVLTTLVLIRGWLHPPHSASNKQPASGTSEALNEQEISPSANRLLVSSEAASILNEVSDIIFQVDADGCWSYLNEAWERITGQSVAESLGRPCLQSFHQDDRTHIQDRLNTLSYDPSTCICEGRLRSNQGRYVRVEIRARRSSEGQSLSYLSGTLSDISSRWAAEESLRQKRHMLNTLLSNVPGMAYRCRLARVWRMEFVSDGCFELTGYEAADLINNRKVTYANLIHPADRDSVWQLCQSELSQRRVSSLEYRIQTRNDETKWVWEQMRGVFSATGELLALEGFISDITERKLTEERVRREFIWDELTGLQNNIVFLEWLGYALSHAQINQHAFAVIVLDLDDFGRWNRHNGQEWGDRILEEIGRRLANMVTACNVAARLEGDEFAVLLSDFSVCGFNDEVPFDVVEGAGKFGKILQDIIRKPMTFDGIAVQVSASIGVAVSESHYENGEAMLREAKNACVRAKFLRPTRLVFADPNQDNDDEDGKHMRSLLAGALGANALEICYQPVFDLSTRALVWWEPSLIWQHPRRGRLDLLEGYPALQAHPEFLSLITSWLIREVTQESHVLQSTLHLEDAESKFCIAIPALGLLEPSVIDELLNCLSKHDLNPDQCIISVGQITDAIDQEQFEEVLQHLRRKGLTLLVEIGDNALSESLSDGASQTDHHCDLRKMKVDDPILTLARIQENPGCSFVACDLATEEALEFALQSGCSYGQGDVLGEKQDRRSIAERWLTKSKLN
jgi:diguanylate cyclase (GGDEF)-like protein/PAS domain S-box-containing protein